MNPQMTKKSNLYVHGLMLLTMLLIASSFPVGAAITYALPPEVMMFIRFLVAAALFAPYVFIKNGFVIPANKKLFGYAVLSIPLVIFFWCMFESLRFTSAINTGALYTTVPFITTVLSFLINRERTDKKRLLGLLIGTLGALWVVFRGDINALLQLNLNEGDLIFLVGCLFMGLYGPLIKRIYSGEPMVVMTFWVILFGSGWLLLLSANSLGQVDWYNVDTKVYAGVLYLSVFTTLISFFLLQFSTVKIGPTKVAAYSFLTPIFVILLSVLILDVDFEWMNLPGLLLVLIAMFFIQKDSPDVERREN